MRSWCPLFDSSSVDPDSAVSIVTTASWTVWGWNPNWGKIFCTHSDWPWGPPSHLCNWYDVFFLGVKWPGRGIDHPPPTCAEVRERYSYTCTPHLVFMVCCRVASPFQWTLPSCQFTAAVTRWWDYHALLFIFHMPSFHDRLFFFFCSVHIQNFCT